MSSRPNSNSASSPAAYGEASIRVLKGLEPVKQRPGMYTRTDNPLHIIQEVIDNAADEALAGFCDEITVTIHPDNSISVADNGRGIPTDIHPDDEEKRSTAELVMTELHAGGKFNEEGGAYKVSGGLHGVGASVVNALSAELKVEVKQNGKVFQQSFERGKTVSNLDLIGKTDKSGTSVTFKPDAEIFETLEYNHDTIANRLRELAFLMKGLRFQFVDEKNNKNESNYHKRP